jgi:hypothetical protein
MAMPVYKTPPSASRPASASRSGAAPGRWVLVVLALLTVAGAIGAPYFVLSAAERLRSPLHAWFKPSGYVGQTTGLVTFAGFLFMWLFPLRKKLRKADYLGPVPRWLDIHIGVGLVLPLAGAIHAGFRVGGLIGLGYISMLIVCASGIVGRYLYVRIPRGRSGVELGLGEVAAQQRALLGEISEATGLSVPDVQEILKVDTSAVRSGIVAAFSRMVRDDVARVRAIRTLRRRLKTAGSRTAALHKVSMLARRQMSLSQQARLLDRTQTVFRYWHAAHRPFAITAFIAVTIHVVVVIAVGATWF